MRNKDTKESKEKLKFCDSILKKTEKISNAVKAGNDKAVLLGEKRILSKTLKLAELIAKKLERRNR